MVGIFAVLLYLCGPAATDAMNTALTDAQKDSFWYPSFLVFSAETAKILPNSLLIVTLASNFGTFLLYMLTCVIAIVAFREHHSFSGIKHVVIPGVRRGGQPGLHALLPGRAVHGHGDEQAGAVSSPWAWPPCGASMERGISWLASGAKGRGILVEQKPAMA